MKTAFTPLEAKYFGVCRGSEYRKNLANVGFNALRGFLTGFTIFLIIGFIMIAVFGAFTMNHISANGHSGCIAVTAQRTICPMGGAFSFIAFHFKAFRSFTTAIFGDGFAGMTAPLIVLLSIFAIGFFAKINPTPLLIKADCNLKRFPESNSFSPQQKLIHWLALRENSPSAS